MVSINQTISQKQLTSFCAVVCIGMKDNKDIKPEINKLGVRLLSIIL